MFSATGISQHDPSRPITKHKVHGAAQFEVPRQFGDFRLLQVLGVGGTADVYAATSSHFEMPIALKIVRHDHRTAEARARHHEEVGCELLEWEFQVGRDLNHPNVMRVFEHGQVDDTDYVAMELFEAPTLDDYLHELEARGRLLPHFVQIIGQCAAGLGHLHAAGYVHCDVKPGNFLLGADCEVKLIDFDICTRIIDPKQFHPPKWIAATGGFISPEQRHKQPLDERTDIYSLGVLMHIWLTGEMPYAERRSMTVHEQIELPVVPMVRRLNGNVSEELADLLARMLSDEKENRPRTMEQFLIEFRTLEPFCGHTRTAPLTNG